LRTKQIEGLATTDMHISKLSDDGPLSARKLKVWEIAAITGGSVVVMAAGAMVGYLCYIARQNSETEIMDLSWLLNDT
jgi:hypothetical protein